MGFWPFGSDTLPEEIPSEASKVTNLIEVLEEKIKESRDQMTEVCRKVRASLPPEPRTERS